MDVFIVPSGATVLLKLSFLFFLFFVLLAQWEAVSSIFKEVGLIHISEREAFKGSDAEKGLLPACEGGFLEYLKLRKKYLLWGNGLCIPPLPSY